MAKLDVKITRPDGETLVDQQFEITPKLAEEFIEKMKDMVAGLPVGRRRRISESTRPDGTRIIEIDIEKGPPPVISPTFQELFQIEGSSDDD